ncbi:MAG: hypothetical protein HYY84_10230 [Deltaproteobacteria bacterium]|nr:hypothetical protein [Deltaproteobacteria bacterium]
MKQTLLLYLGTVVAIAAGCPKSEDVVRRDGSSTVAPRAEAHSRAAAPAWAAVSPVDEFFRAHIGKCVVVFGYALEAKWTAKLVGPGFGVDVAFPDGAWPSSVRGARVRVQGIVAERSDRPVFIPRAGEPIVQGIPVAPGTDLAKARRRIVLENVKATRVRERADVDRDLARQRGTRVTLTGVVWSLNNRWWFNHDGVEIHVDSLAQRPGFDSSMRGRPVALTGLLERRSLPRLDQITLKATPDLAEAYILMSPSFAPHPSAPPEVCGTQPPAR